MAIVVKTSRPKGLVKSIKTAINEDRITRWGYDEDGDFTRKDGEWARKAWLRPVFKTEGVVFKIFPPADTVMSSVVYAVYHARFVEMLLRNFDTMFEGATATALPRMGDRVNTRTSRTKTT